MELTNELKARFFALYLGQKVFYDAGLEEIHSVVKPVDLCYKKGWLFLRPLSSITEEEIKDMCKNMYPTVIEGFDRDAVIAALTGEESVKGYDNTLPQFFENLDWLRSKGFLMDAFGIKSGQWVEWGVVKLKTE